MAHITFKVYGEDARMAKEIGRFSNFSNICLYALRAYYKMLTKFYGPKNPLTLQHDDIAPPPYEYLLVPVKAAKYLELAELSQKIEAATGQAMGVEHLIARAMDATSMQTVEKSPDPFPNLEQDFFRIYAEHLDELK